MIDSNDTANPSILALNEKLGYHPPKATHATHPLGLYRTGVEILAEQAVRFRRPGAARLREMLQGHYSYDKLMALVVRH